ncbi:Uncharacterized membrane protein [Gemmobacter aquatilis]|uniref:Uncharacterized membrane protein n=1 Tax=Gemmobacter aquatilis TaxID=933059 RepID=A0A1H8BI16_9RHOB|nr:DUF2189 domain-containing protein [Gemmobacter aquatilis]SEM82560.1 Uncharacterized membrane protein [Gemmobacter aquatilis]
MPQTETGPPDVPEINEVGFADLAASLRAGLRDFGAAPLYGLAFSAVYVLGGWLILWAVTAKGQLWWTLPASAGFPILGPFIACGFYEISRRLQAGEALQWGGIAGVIFRQKDRQIPSMAAVIVVFFLFWNFLAHMIFALFLGTSTLTNISSSFEVFLTGQGLLMLLIGSGVGAVFATLLYALTVVSLPLLLEREVDFVTAMLTSFALVQANPLVMLAWGAFVGASLFLAMLPGFLGLLVVLPVLGHATWHLYRRALS